MRWSILGYINKFQNIDENTGPFTMKTVLDTVYGDDDCSLFVHSDNHVFCMARDTMSEERKQWENLIRLLLSKLQKDWSYYYQLVDDLVRNYDELELMTSQVNQKKQQLHELIKPSASATVAEPSASAAVAEPSASATVAELSQVVKEKTTKKRKGVPLTFVESQENLLQQKKRSDADDSSLIDGLSDDTIAKDGSNDGVFSAAPVINSMPESENAAPVAEPSPPVIVTFGRGQVIEVHHSAMHAFIINGLHRPITGCKPGTIMLEDVMSMVRVVGRGTVDPLTQGLINLFETESEFTRTSEKYIAAEYNIVGCDTNMGVQHPQVSSSRLLCFRAFEPFGLILFVDFYSTDIQFAFENDSHAATAIRVISPLEFAETSVYFFNFISKLIVAFDPEKVEGMTEFKLIKWIGKDYCFFILLSMINASCTSSYFFILLSMINASCTSSYYRETVERILKRWQGTGICSF